MSNTTPDFSAADIKMIRDLARAELVATGELPVLSLVAGTPPQPTVGLPYRHAPITSGGAGQRFYRVDNSFPSWLTLEYDTGASYAAGVPASALVAGATFNLYVIDLTGTEVSVSVTIPKAAPNIAVAPKDLVLFSLDGSNNPIEPVGIATANKPVNFLVSGRVPGIDVTLVGDLGGLSLSNTSNIADTRLTGTATKGEYKATLRQSIGDFIVKETKVYLLVSDTEYAPFTADTGTFGLNTSTGNPFNVSNHSAKKPWSISRGVADPDLIRFALSDSGETWGGSLTNVRSELKLETEVPMNTDFSKGFHFRFANIKPPNYLSGNQWLSIGQLHVNLEAGETAKSPIIEVELARRDDGKIVLRLVRRNSSSVITDNANITVQFFAFDTPPLVNENVWHNIRFKFKIDYTGQGYLYAYLDGVNIARFDAIALGYNDVTNPYLKVGFYGSNTVLPLADGKAIAWIEYKGYRAGTVAQDDLIFSNPNPMLTEKTGLLINAVETTAGWTVQNGVISLADGPGFAGTKAVQLGGTGVAGDVLGAFPLGKYNPKKMDNIAVALRWLDNPSGNGSERIEVQLGVKVGTEQRWYRYLNFWGFKPINGTTTPREGGTFILNMTTLSGSSYVVDGVGTTTANLSALADGLYDISLRVVMTEAVAPYAQKVQIDAVAAGVAPTLGTYLTTVDDSEGSWFVPFAELTNTFPANSPGGAGTFSNMTPAEYWWRSGLLATWFIVPRGPISGPATDAQGIIWPQRYRDSAALVDGDPKKITGQYTTGVSQGTSKLTQANIQQLHDWNQGIAPGSTQDIRVTHEFLATPVYTAEDYELLKNWIISRGWVRPISGRQNYEAYVTSGTAPAVANALLDAYSYIGAQAQASEVTSSGVLNSDGTQTLVIGGTVSGTVKPSDKLIQALANPVNVIGVDGVNVIVDGPVPAGTRPALFWDQTQPHRLGALRPEMKAKGVALYRGVAALDSASLFTAVGFSDAVFGFPSNSFSGTSTAAIAGRILAAKNKLTIFEHVHGIYASGVSNTLGPDILHFKAKADALRAEVKFGAADRTIDMLTIAGFLAKDGSKRFPQAI